MKSTALLIDDDPIDLKAMELLLAEWDLQVVTAHSGAAGLDALKAAPVDVVVSDVRMQGMSGEDVVRQTAAAYPGLPVVLITGHGDVRSAVAAMKLGAFDYVLKPPDPDELRLTVERAIEHARLRKENEFLRAELAAGGMYGERMVGRSRVMLDLYALVDRVAHTDSTVLITGETGTGKELVAQTLHFRGPRGSGPFIALNCAAVNPNLIESELFGHEKGAFTGAVTSRRGRFEDAHGGSLFLDEIAETPIEFQAKLLRVLQEGRFERVGGNQPVTADVRVIASTNRNLSEWVREGRFREDLYYRLSVIPVHLPPLRERTEDVPLLAAHFVRVYSARYTCPAREISAAAMDWLQARKWHGNVRELQHAVERAVILATGPVLEPRDFQFPEPTGQEPEELLTLQDILDRKTREHLLEVLDRTGWRKQKTARLLGIDRATLYRLLKKHSLERSAAGRAER